MKPLHANKGIKMPSAILMPTGTEPMKNAMINKTMAAMPVTPLNV